MIDVIIPARNEENTIGDVLSAFMPTPLIRGITVVIDPDTTDETEAAAVGTLKDRPNSAVVHCPVGGKGQCVKYGIGFSDADRYMFCDADYIGLTRFHVEALTREYSGIMIGVPKIPDTLPLQSYHAWPWVSGFRTVPAFVVKDVDLHGYLMEIQINRAAYDYHLSPTMLIHMRGLHSPYRMTAKRVDEMNRDREWGLKHGALPPIMA